LDSRSYKGTAIVALVWVATPLNQRIDGSMIWRTCIILNW